MPRLEMSKAEDNTVVQRVWALCHILRGDGISYHQYISELTYLLFLKIAEETGAEDLLPEGYRWRDLAQVDRPDLLTFYREMLTHLGGYANSKAVRDIYALPLKAKACFSLMNPTLISIHGGASTI